MNIKVPPPPNETGTPKWVDDQKAKSEDQYWGNEKQLRDAKTWADVWWAKVYGVTAILLRS